MLSKKGPGKFLIAGPRPSIKGGTMVEVEIKRMTVANGTIVAPGDVVEVSKSDASYLVSIGKAVPVSEAPKPENRDDEIAKKTSKRATQKKG